MAFKPSNTAIERAPRDPDYVPGVYPVPRAGSRKARVSLVIEMGKQERESIWKNGDKIVQEGAKGSVLMEQNPAQQVAIFVDLTHDTVDYGGAIGKAHYRLPVNSVFQGTYKGINFQGVPQKDASGTILTGADGKWLPLVLHPASPLTKLAKAVGRPDIVESMDISQFIGEDGEGLPFMATVEIKETPAKNGKEDAEGNPIIYKNVNFKGQAPIPEDDDGNQMAVNPLAQPALCITFADAKEEDIKWIRAGLRKQIKLALDYPGSQMQKAIEAFEAKQAAEADGPDNGDDDAPAPAPKPAAKTASKAVVPAKKTAAKPPAKVPFDDMESDIPF